MAIEGSARWAKLVYERMGSPRFVTRDQAFEAVTAEFPDAAFYFMMLVVDELMTLAEQAPLAPNEGVW